MFWRGSLSSGPSLRLAPSMTHTILALLLLLLMTELVCMETAVVIARVRFIHHGGVEFCPSFQHMYERLCFVLEAEKRPPRRAHPRGPFPLPFARPMGYIHILLSSAH